MDEFENELRRLLAGLDEGADRSARERLLRELLDAGVPREQLARAAAEDRLATLPIELVFTRDGVYSLRELLADTGLTPDYVRRSYLALGLAVPGDDERVISAEELHAWRMLKLLLDAGLPEERMLVLSRIAGRGAAQLAAAVIETFIRHYLKPGDTERDFGLRLADLATNLTPTLGPLVESPVRLHIRELVRREVVGRTARATGEVPGTREITVAFVDLVGFASLSERLPLEELSRVTDRLEELAGAVATPPVRLIKLIGDAAMLVSEHAPALVASVDALVAAIERDEYLPSVRAGIAAGHALHRVGDWFGPPVNLASRIAGVAEPGSTLATRAVVDATGGEARWSDCGSRSLKGMGAPVALFRIERDN